MRATECPLGIVDIDGGCDLEKCRNRDYCEAQTQPWLIPYHRSFDGSLVVETSSILKYHNQAWEDAMEESSGAYCEYLDGVYSQESQWFQRWVNEVEEVGWIEAHPLPYQCVDGFIVVILEFSEHGFYPAVELSENPGFPDIERWNDWDVPDARYLIPKL